MSEGQMIKEKASAPHRRQIHRCLVQNGIPGSRSLETVQPSYRKSLYRTPRCHELVSQY